MYSINDLKKEVLISVDGVPYRVVESQHVSLGRGGAVMRTKLKNLLNGTVLERTFRPAEKVAPAEITRAQMQYLYREGDQLHLMNETSFEQESVAAEILGNQANFLSEGSTVTTLHYQGKIIGVEMTKSVILQVNHTEPGVRGDTATAALKPATLETGAQVQVPLFINNGDRVKVDTRSGQYLERAK